MSRITILLLYIQIERKITYYCCMRFIERLTEGNLRIDPDFNKIDRILSMTGRNVLGIGVERKARQYWSKTKFAISEIP